MPIDRYLFESPAIGVTPKSSMTAAFPHVVSGLGNTPDATFYSQWQSSPFADEYLARWRSTSRGVWARPGAAHGLPRDQLSTLDKVGHDFGPNSHETQDVLIRLDRTLGVLLDGLDRFVGKDHYVVALSADHGVAPIPERARILGLDSGRVASATIQSAVEDALVGLGPGAHVARIVNSDVYLAPGVWPVLRERPEVLAGLRDALVKVPGVLNVYTRDQMRTGLASADPIEAALARGYDAERSGNLCVPLKPYWLLTPTGASHGSSYGYDTRVPVFLMGPGVAAGRYLEAASPADIAPTLAFLAGITLPRAQGRVLTEAVAAKAPVLR